MMRTLRGWTRMYLAVAETSIFCSCPLAELGPPLRDAARVAAVRAGRRELAELVADHVLGDEHGDVLTPVVHRERVADEIGMMVERRLQVLMSRFSSDALRVSTFSMRWSSTKYPFLRLLAIILPC